MSWEVIYLLCWIATAILSTMMVRFCIAIAPRLGYVDIPQHEAHKNHRKSTPVMGGAGMLFSWLIVLWAGCIAASRFLAMAKDDVNYLHDVAEVLKGMPSVSKNLTIIVGCAIFVTMLGMRDDRKAMKALPKFLGQAVAAIITVACGLHISFLHQIPLANEIVTILWIMGLMNAMNFFDNMDGLAGGASVIAAFFMLFVASLRGQYFVATLAAVTGGAATGFLVWNAPPARLFMGDGGSHFLGYLLAVLGIMTTFYLPNESPTPAPILIPLFILGIPLADAVAVVIIRLRLGVPIYKGDNRHISHRFVKLGLTRPQAVLSVLLMCMILGIAGVTLLWLPLIGTFLVMGLVAALFGLISIIQFYVTEIK